MGQQKRKERRFKATVLWFPQACHSALFALGTLSCVTIDACSPPNSSATASNCRSLDNHGSIKHLQTRGQPGSAGLRLTSSNFPSFLRRIDLGNSLTNSRENGMHGRICWQMLAAR